MRTPLGKLLAQFDGGDRGVASVPCEGEWIACPFYRAESRTGLLIVSGGNEIAIGPQRSMARLAAIIADEGWSVIRFDRRGIGDSDGTNGGHTSIGPDLEAAQRWAAHIGVKRLVAFGNCDAATALATLPLRTTPPRYPSDPAPIVARLLGNPWLGDREDGLPAPAAIRDRYRRRLADPAAWRALLAGEISLRGLAKGLARLARRPNTGQLSSICRGLERLSLPTEIVLSARDATGIAFNDAWRKGAPPALRRQVAVYRFDTASHGFTRDEDLAQLASILSATLRAADART